MTLIVLIRDEILKVRKLRQREIIGERDAESVDEVIGEADAKELRARRAATRLNAGYERENGRAREGRWRL